MDTFTYPHGLAMVLTHGDPNSPKYVSSTHFMNFRLQNRYHVYSWIPRLRGLSISFVRALARCASIEDPSRITKKRARHTHDRGFGRDQPYRDPSAYIVLTFGPEVGT